MSVWWPHPTRRTVLTGGQALFEAVSPPRPQNILPKLLAQRPVTAPSPSRSLTVTRRRSPTPYPSTSRRSPSPSLRILVPETQLSPSALAAPVASSSQRQIASPFRFFVPETQHAPTLPIMATSQQQLPPPADLLPEMPRLPLPSPPLPASTGMTRLAMLAALKQACLDGERAERQLAEQQQPFVPNGLLGSNHDQQTTTRNFESASSFDKLFPPSQPWPARAHSIASDWTGSSQRTSDTIHTYSNTTDSGESEGKSYP